MKKTLPETIEKAIIQRQSSQREATWLAMGAPDQQQVQPRVHVRTTGAQGNSPNLPVPSGAPGQPHQSPKGGSPS